MSLREVFSNTYAYLPSEELLNNPKREILSKNEPRRYLYHASLVCCILNYVGCLNRGCLCLIEERLWFFQISSIWRSRTELCISGKQSCYQRFPHSHGIPLQNGLPHEFTQRISGTLREPDGGSQFHRLVELTNMKSRIHNSPLWGLGIRANSPKSKSWVKLIQMNS